MRRTLRSSKLTGIVFMVSINVIAQQKQPVDYVDPFIGTEHAGNTFPGPSLPFGMARVSADCIVKAKFPNTNSGYASNAPVYGFSQTHVSGTGGGAKYGNVALMPIVGDVDLNDHYSLLENEVANAGYFKAALTKGKIGIELTATHSVGIHRYTFPASEQAAIIVDASAFLVKGSTIQRLVKSRIKIVSPTVVEGFETVKGGWNEGAPYTVYFYMETNTPSDASATWRNNVITDGSKNSNPSSVRDSTNAGAVLYFHTTQNQQIVAKVGISFISIAKAKQNFENEARYKSFDQIRSLARSKWNDLLSRISVQGTDEQKTAFYTALYHTLLMPSERSGENPLWKSKEPYYDDFYAVWDTYRASNPLITLIDQKRQENILRSLIDIYNYEGWMPDARSGNYSGLTQGGTDADVLFADAWLKGLKHIDYRTAYKSMVQNAEVEPNFPKKDGRGGITDYKNLGYVPSETVIAGSRTVEYANNDAAVATLAAGLGFKADAEKYKLRASNWENLWRRDAASLGAKGFIWPKKQDGTWDNNYDYFKKGNFKGFLYEGDTWTYSLFVPHDVRKLIEKCGGKQAFVNRLDTFFTKKIYDVNNEPGFLSACLYTWAGRPDKTAETIRKIISQSYNTKRGGLPGNDDSGAMSSWLAMNMMGFYPNTGQDIYIITSPVFKKTVLKMAGGKTLTIIATNANEQNIYITTATLNNKPLKRSWFKHGEIKNGAVLKFVMGDKPSTWGMANPPPSLSDNKTIN